MYKNILVPIDGSNTAQRGLNEAVGLAKTLGSRIRLVHAINDAELISPYASGTNYEDLFDQVERHGTALLQEAEAAVRAAGVAVDTKLLEANGVVVGEQVLQAAANWAADLIVCGTHGRRGLRRIVMGSDAEYIVRQSPVPVLLVRAGDGAV
ncbi:MAG TPA: universal stress protein [Steroidobacteraceae bacterium]|nr:universal stress protein [Steroidobacteraceae bacterium]